jgi:adenylate cyclase
VPRELIANRTVFVGAHSISAVPDNYPVPNSGSQKMWGVEIWANTAASIFTNRFPEIREGFVATLVQMLITTLGGILLVTRFRLYGFLGAIALLVAYGVARFTLFQNATASDVGDGPIAIASIGYLLPASFWWVVALGYLLVEEQRAVRRTQTTFGRFVTPSIARTIMDIEESGKLALGGEEKRVTVLFGDIRGFTTLSEGMTPRVLLDTLNRYFEGIVNVVNRYEGTVNKYNGDNIMVIWGAPLPVADQARKAVQAALEIQRWIVAERATGGPDVSFGFGINTGPVVAGFLGALGRMEYTVIGDTANVASRLTSNDIARRDQVAVSAETLAELGDDVVALDLGAIQVKGRAEAVRCYQVNSVGGVESPNPAPAPEKPIGAAAVAGYH